MKRGSLAHCVSRDEGLCTDEGQFRHYKPDCCLLRKALASAIDSSGGRHHHIRQREGESRDKYRERKL